MKIRFSFEGKEYVGKTFGVSATSDECASEMWRAYTVYADHKLFHVKVTYKYINWEDEDDEDEGDEFEVKLLYSNVRIPSLD